MLDQITASEISTDSLYTSLFEALPGNCLLLQSDAPTFTILAATPHHLRDGGTTRESIIGKGVFEAYPPNSADVNDTGASNLRASLEKVLAGKQPDILPVQRYDVAGEDGTYAERFWRVENRPVLTQAGESAFILHMVVEVTDQVKAGRMEQKIKDMEQANKLFMQAPVPIQIYRGSDLIIELANAPTLAIWGKSTDIIGKPLEEALPEIKGTPFPGLLLQVMKTGEPYYMYDTPATFTVDGKEKQSYFDSIYQPYYVPGISTAAGVLVFGFDVTQKILAEKEKQESEERFRTLADQAPMMIFLADSDGVVTFWNRYWLDYTGQTAENAFGRTRDKVIHPDDYGKALEIFLAASTDRKSYSLEARVKRWDGEYRYFLFTGGPRYSADDSFLGNFGTGVDIHDRQVAQRAVHEGEQDLRSMILSAPIGICVMDAATRVSQVANELFVEIAGKPLDEIVGQFYWDTFSLARPYYEAALTKVVEEGITYKAEEVEVPLLRHGKQEIVHVTFVYEPLKDEHGRVKKVAVWVLDNTRQVLARRTVEQSENNLRNTILQAPVAMSILRGPEFVLEIANNGMYELWGRSKEELLGRSIFKGLPEATNQGFEEFISDVYYNGKPFSAYGIPVVLPRSGGPETVYINVLYTPFREGDGSISGVIVVAMDITPQKIAADVLEGKVAERTKALQEANRSLQHLNSELEQFNSVSHHDLQEPVRKIIMFSEMIKNDSYERLTEASRTRLDKVTRAAHRMREALSDILGFARLSMEEQSVPVNLNEVLNNVRGDVELVISEKQATINADELPVIKAVPGQMNQLFYNLLNNALKFTKAGQPPIINITSRALTNTEVLEHPELDTNKTYYRIEVSDNGIGFDMGMAEKIFGMFQRLHSRDEYAGTGIGLALVKKVVQKHGGKIWAQGKPGDGATFIILLPGL
jgi:PAS domain S-box-containing protein